MYTRAVAARRQSLVYDGFWSSLDGARCLNGAAPGNSAASGFGDVHRAVSTNYECVRIWSVRVLFVRIWIDIVEHDARSMRLCNAPDDSYALVRRASGARPCRPLRRRRPPPVSSGLQLASLASRLTLAESRLGPQRSRSATAELPPVPASSSTSPTDR